MKKSIGFLAALLLGGLLVGHLTAAATQEEANMASKQLNVFSVEQGKDIMTDKVVKSEEEWKKILTPEQFRILREHGTEGRYTSELLKNHEHGVYRCAACGLDLFSSETKYDSQTGWPSFYTPVAKENIGTSENRSFFMVRTEVHCPRCGGHLGHLFNDGPKPTGLRYCINGAALQFSAIK